MKKHKITNWFRKQLAPGFCNPWITVAMIVLTAFGSLMLVSTSLGTALGSPSSLLRETLKQALIVAASVFFYLCAARFFHWNAWGTFSILVWLVFFMLMAAVFLAGFEFGGSRAWLMIGGVSFQPSEMAKPLIIASCGYAIFIAVKKKRTRESFWKINRRPLILLAIVIGLVLAQKDVGTLIIIVCIAMICFLVPGWKSLQRGQMIIKTAFLIGLVVSFVGVYATNGFSTMFREFGVFPHMATRIDNMKNPYLDVYGEGYQPANALYGIADAGLFGKGIGNSARKYGYLTQADSDYIIAVTIEETGVAGLALISAGYGIIVWQLFTEAKKTKYMADKVLYIGAMSYLLLHYIINIGGVITLIPMTGVPLLFISGGGSSMLSIFVTMGMVQGQMYSRSRLGKEKA